MTIQQRVIRGDLSGHGPPMKLPDYLTEVEHAVRTVITEIHAEQQHLTRLQLELTALTAATDDGYQRAEFLALNPDLDDEGLGMQLYA